MNRSRHLLQYYAKPGEIYAVVKTMPNGLRRMRLYVMFEGPGIVPGLRRVDTMVPKTVFDEILERLPHENERISYLEVDPTNGQDESGFGWSHNSSTNTALAIIYALADALYANRNAWKVFLL